VLDEGLPPGLKDHAYVELPVEVFVNVTELPANTVVGFAVKLDVGTVLIVTDVVAVMVAQPPDAVFV
jgi:hypothetical protein